MVDELQFHLPDKHPTNSSPVWSNRNLWEGGDQGEKIINVLKPLRFGFRKNWQ
jgi:hypothetical protein